MKVGIIGCSWIAVGDEDCHVNAYLDNDDTEIVAVCDIDLMKALHHAELLNCHVYSDYKEMLNEKLDIVSVCTPVSTHAEIVKACAGHVRAIYCEKPMAVSLRECDEMIKACKGKTILQINHQRRWGTPTLRFSREIIDSGTHAFDLLRDLFGEVSLLAGITGSDHALAMCASGTTVEVEYVPTMDEHIFEFVLPTKKDRLILRGVEALVSHVKYGVDSKDINSNGYDGREALRLALEFKEMYEKSHSPRSS
jgi:predicted dehydrogenase